MLDLSGSEMLFYGGIALMAAAAVFAVVCAFVFYIKKQVLKQKLEEEYGRLR